MNPTPEQQAALEPLTPDSLRTLGVEVGVPFINPIGREFEIRPSSSLVDGVRFDVWARSHVGGVKLLLAELTTLSQARSLLAGLGISLPSGKGER